VPAIKIKPNPMSDTRLKFLFARFVSESCSEEEKKEFFKLVDSDVYTSEVQELLDEYWLNAPADKNLNPLKAEAIFQKITESGQSENVVRRINTKWMYSVAASLIFVLFFVGYYWRSETENTTITTAKKKGIEKVKDLLPGGNKAILTLGDGTVITLDDTNEGVLANQGNISVKKTKDGQLVYTVNKNSSSKEISINTISTPKGGQYQVVLPDGSKVWLNAASSISFPTVFAGTERRVQIKGEAYFEIAKNASMPFIVSANATEVKVYGTHFNIMAYEDENAIKTTLLEGSVKISSGGKSNMLVPGEQAQVSKSGGGLKVTSEVNLSEVVAWKNGNFEFKDTELEVIMRQIERWYNVEVSYVGKTPTEQFTGKISRNVKASQILNMLEFAGLKFKIAGNTIIVLGVDN
jgi:hypothetical protein